MQKTTAIFALTLSFFLSLPAQAKIQLLNENAQATNRAVAPAQFFSEQDHLATTHIITDPEKLAAVAQETIKWLKKHPNAPIKGSLLEAYGISQADVLRTLTLIVQTVAEDKQTGQKSRLQDQAWLEQHFRLLAWSADRTGAQSNKVNVPDQRLRITKYVVFEAQGQIKPSASHSCALYAVPDEEINLSDSEAENKKNTLMRYRFTKQQVINGALKDKSVKPLVWLTRQGLEDALMQGSLLVKMPDGKARMFNVHRNNGIGYDRKIKDPRQQNRYWFFKEVEGILGYGKDDKILVQPGVTFAGDVYNIGLGKLIAIRYPQSNGQVLRLGILADTGGAFVPNLYQLDYLAGIYPTRDAYQKGVAALPSFAQAFILIAH